MFLLSLLQIAYREPVGIAMEMYNKEMFQMKIEDQSPYMYVCVINVPGYGGHENNYLIETFQTAAGYVAAYPNIFMDFGMFMDTESKSEDAFVTLNHPKVKPIPIFIDNTTLPKVLAHDILQEAHRIAKTYKKQRDDERNPKISKINMKIRTIEKLIKTAVDKADARMNQKKKEELQEELKEYYPKDKLERMKLRKEIRACVNETEKEELIAKLNELKQNRDTTNWTDLDYMDYYTRQGAKEIAEARKMLDDAQELKDLRHHRDEMERYEEYYGDGEEERNMAELMAAAADVADNETEAKEYASKADKFRKLAKIRDEYKVNKTRERAERRRKERIAKKKAEELGDDQMELPDELFESEDGNETEGEYEEGEYEEGEYEYEEGDDQEEQYDNEEGDDQEEQDDNEEGDEETPDEEDENEETNNQEEKDEETPKANDIPEEPHEDDKELSPEEL